MTKEDTAVTRQEICADIDEYITTDGELTTLKELFQSSQVKGVRLDRDPSEFRDTVATLTGLINELGPVAVRMNELSDTIGEKMKKLPEIALAKAAVDVAIENLRETAHAIHPRVGTDIELSIAFGLKDAEDTTPTN